MLDIDDVITSRLQVASVARTAASDGSLYVYDGFLNFLTREELKELSKTETPEQTGREEAYRNPPPLPGLEAAMLVYTHRWWVRTIGTFIHTHTLFVILVFYHQYLLVFIVALHSQLPLFLFFVLYLSSLSSFPFTGPGTPQPFDYAKRQARHFQAAFQNLYLQEPYDPRQLDTRINVYWPADKKWYPAVIVDGRSKNPP